MTENLEIILERIANALERQNILLENKESRQIKIDKLAVEKTKLQIKESKIVKKPARPEPASMYTNKNKPRPNKKG